MIDTHTHILPFIDDGSESLEDSYRMIEEELAMGVKHIIITPHVLRIGLPRFSKAEYLEKFKTFKNDVESKYDVNLYFGQEISYHPDLIKLLQSGELFTINNTRYILLELPYNKQKIDYNELFYSLSILKYKVIIAHIERYEYLSFADIMAMKKFSILYQVNSNSITGASGSRVKKLSHRLLKNNLVDIVASDVHSFRRNDLSRAYDIVVSVFSEKIAEHLFKKTPFTLFLENNNL